MDARTRACSTTTASTPSSLGPVRSTDVPPKDPVRGLSGLVDNLLGGHLGNDGVRSIVEALDELVVVGHPLALWKAH